MGNIGACLIQLCTVQQGGGEDGAVDCTVHCTGTVQQVVTITLPLLAPSLGGLTMLASLRAHIGA